MIVIPLVRRYFLRALAAKVGKALSNKIVRVFECELDRLCLDNSARVTRSLLNPFL